MLASTTRKTTIHLPNLNNNTSDLKSTENLELQNSQKKSKFMSITDSSHTSGQPVEAKQCFQELKETKQNFSNRFIKSLNKKKLVKGDSIFDLENTPRVADEKNVKISIYQRSIFKAKIPIEKKYAVHNIDFDTVSTTSSEEDSLKPSIYEFNCEQQQTKEGKEEKKVVLVEENFEDESEDSKILIEAKKKIIEDEKNPEKIAVENEKFPLAKKPTFGDYCNYRQEEQEIDEESQ